MSAGAARLCWGLFGLLVLAQIGYPLTDGAARAPLTIATVLIGYALSVWHAYAARGARTTAALVAVTTLGGLAVEAIGVASGFPFGQYGYTGALGPRLLGVPLVIPLAWTWMAWPAWLAAARLVRGTTASHAAARIGLAGIGLAAWDLFLDPQMVAEGYWTWADPSPALPGVPDVPIGNYVGWLVVAVAMMAALARVAGPRAAEADAPMYALFGWTYGSSVLAHAVFLDLPSSALWGGIAMGTVAVPLAVSLLRGSR